MTDQPSLFEAPRKAPEQPRKAAEERTSKKRPALKPALLERFKSHKYQAFSWAAILKAYPERQEIHVERALRALLKDGDVKALPAEGSKPVRYTLTVYKAGGLKR